MSDRIPYEEGKSAWRFFKSFGTKPENPYETKSYKEGDYDKCNEWNKGFNDAENEYYNMTSSRKSVKSGFYNDPVNHPEGGGTCDYCGADVAPGDYYEANFDSTHDHTAMQLYLALGGDPNYAYEVVENIRNFVIWLQQVDEEIDEDRVQDMISEVVDMAFPNDNDYFCHDCLDSRLKDAAKKWVKENW